jgi:predicted ArsR family transcriptional regulator
MYPKSDAELASRRRGAKKAQHYRIEQENVTIAQIAQRLGVTPSCARTRMRELRGASGAVTWSRLAAFGKRESAA